MHRTRALAALLVAAPLSVAALPATAAALPAPQELRAGTDVASLVDDQIVAAAGSGIDELWERALGLRDLVPEDARGELDRELDRRLSDADGLDPRAVLLASACALEADEPELETLLRALLPLLFETAEDDALAAAAAGLLGNASFKTRLSSDLQEERLEALLAAARDASRSPELRLAAATAAYRTGSGREKREARREMLAFLDSSDVRLRRLGALTLARIGEELTGSLQRELKRLAALPGEEGALAEAFLKQQQVRELHDRKYKELVQRYEQKQLPEELAIINAVMRLVESDHLDGDKFERDELMQSAINGMLRALDEHSAYLDPEFFKRFTQDLEANYGGIGAYVDVDPGDGLFTITRPIYSGPAYKAGLMSDDKIVRIDDWPTLGERRDDIIKRLKGKPGTDVVLYIWRRGMDPGQIDRPTEDMAVHVTRGYIEIPALAAQLLPGGVGLIDLREFSRVTTTELRDSIEKMSAQGMEALVLDLRRNSGGLLTEARSVADLFLPRGLRVVSTESRTGREEVLKTRWRASVPEDMPVVILVGRFTASAAEIVSGALQDHERALVVGQRSFGKGSVQTLVQVPGTQSDEFIDENDNDRWDDWERITKDWNGNGEYDYAPFIKLTVARYVLPSGRSIHRELDRDRNIVDVGGVVPDIDVDVPRVEAWRLEERYRIMRDQLAREYVSERWEEHRDLFTHLANYDAEDPSLYPDFDEFMVSLKTVLSRQDVRRILRQEVRRRVQDDQGAEFPGFGQQGDFQEDVELQVAIREALDALDVDVESVEEFAATFELPDDEDEDQLENLAALTPSSDELATTRALLQAARAGDGVLSKDTLDAILAILNQYEREQRN